MPSATLEQVLADARGELPVLRRHGASVPVAQVEQLLDAIAEATEDYRRFLFEPDARLHSGASVPWLRAQFTRWEAEGHAYRDHGKRFYRQIVLPRRADTARARAAGLRGGATPAADGEISRAS